MHALCQLKCPKINLTSHFVAEHGVESAGNSVCCECMEVIPIRDLRNHIMEMHHLQLNQEVLTCKICLSVFRNHVALNACMNSHSQLMKFGMGRQTIDCV